MNERALTTLFFTALIGALAFARAASAIDGSLGSDLPLYDDFASDSLALEDSWDDPWGASDPLENPSWGEKNALNGVWGSLSRSELDEPLAVESDSDSLGYPSPLAFDSRDDSVGFFRAQIAPPVVSPTTSSNDYYQYDYDEAVGGASNPPVTMSEPTTFKKMFKYQQDCSKSFVYVPRTKRGVGLLEGGTSLYFAIPCDTMRGVNINNGVFRLNPSFDYTGFQWPKNYPLWLKLPNNVFDAGLATSFSFSANDLDATVEVKVGVASSFKKVTSKAIYVRGRAEGSLPVDDDRLVRILGGVAYYGRIKFKLLPVAGVVWRPNARNELRLVFPDPRWGHFLTKVNETDWWFYVQGDFGGGRWLMSDPLHKIGGKTSYNFDYDDYRVSVGLRFDCPKGVVGSFDVGGAFGREVKTKAGTVYKPKSAVLLRAGLFF
ncbi:MAG: hypothetical protein IJM30_09665 [Thermoguttaceae bacterium]|nr:hypothetical protein [Thermoguttaceae bacterium]